MRKGAWRGLGRLICAAGLIWLFFGLLEAGLAALCPAWQRFNALQEEHGLNSGALFYTDVPVSQEAEEAMREAVRKAMSARRERRAAAREKAKADPGAGAPR